MSEFANQQEEDPYVQELNDIFGYAKHVMQDCAAAIRGPLRIEGLETRDDTQILHSAQIIVPNRSPEDIPFWFTTTDDASIKQPFKPETLRVGFALTEQVEHEKVHLFGKWIARLTPLIRPESILEASPKVYSSIQASVWDGSTEYNTRALRVHYFSVNILAAYLSDSSQDIKKLEAQRRNLQAIEHLLGLAVRSTEHSDTSTA